MAEVELVVSVEVFEMQRSYRYAVEDPVVIAQLLTALGAAKLLTTIEIARSEEKHAALLIHHQREVVVVEKWQLVLKLAILARDD